MATGLILRIRQIEPANNRLGSALPVVKSFTLVVLTPQLLGQVLLCEIHLLDPIPDQLRHSRFLNGIMRLLIIYHDIRHYSKFNRFRVIRRHILTNVRKKFLNPPQRKLILLFSNLSHNSFLKCLMHLSLLYITNPHNCFVVPGFESI